MDFGAFAFTPAAVDTLYGQGVVTGATIGLLLTILTLFYARLRA